MARLWQVAFAVWLAGTLWVLLAPDIPSAATDTLSFPGADKVVHLVLFTVGAFLGALAFPTASLGVVFAAAVALGAATELAQGAVPTRTPSFADLVADAAGAGLGVWSAAHLRRRPLRGES